MITMHDSFVTYLPALVICSINLIIIKESNSTRYMIILY